MGNAQIDYKFITDVITTNPIFNFIGTVDNIKNISIDDRAPGDIFFDNSSRQNYIVTTNNTWESIDSTISDTYEEPAKRIVKTTKCPFCGGPLDLERDIYKIDYELRKCPFCDNIINICEEGGY